jgi:hypothetical protein
MRRGDAQGATKEAARELKTRWTNWLREKNQTPDEPPSSLTRARAQQFEDWVTLAVFVALFSGADAYVTAQLSDFAEQVRVRPGAGSSLEVGVGIPTGWGR